MNLDRALMSSKVLIREELKSGRLDSNHRPRAKVEAEQKPHLKPIRILKNLLA